MKHTNGGDEGEGGVVPRDAVDSGLGARGEIPACLQHLRRDVAARGLSEEWGSDAQEVAASAADIEPPQSMRVEIQPAAERADDVQLALEEEAAFGREALANRIVEQFGVIARVGVK